MQPVTELGADTLRDYYETFARVETGTSPIYSAWAQGVAEDDELLALLLDLPGPKRQADLLFAAARHLGAGGGSYADLRAWLLEHWADTRELMLARSTQTNEAGRCATLLPTLAQHPGPLALIEVGASAGLCLYPDRYSYQYAVTDGSDPNARTATPTSASHEWTIRLDPPSGPSEVILDCELANAAVPDRIPEVAWRAGIDLNPLDITDPDQRAWLRSLVWPEHETRRRRLLAASSIAAADPPRLVRGDLLDTVESLLDEVPAGTQPVVFHSAVLAYVDSDARARFASLMQSREDLVWISNEGAGVLPQTRGQLEALGVDAGGRFVLAVNGVPQALTGPHGQTYEGLPTLGPSAGG
ncbi:DUF2332 domain-containing protein [Parenemella sanctibonifatiensis]|uniref:DUF2332 domain-containing protein n=1 Tax=Parenemella sanctibonifatiensis TaxID=2016505 RepID=A0A255ECU8_9ACTN|nr:DUF2332 domain-containing protein [Parenemella sanctibonifatiensis]OYN89090.1 hypothetical protein CGZ91_12570 [Parenemella sanctibonifatiensis]